MVDDKEKDENETQAGKKQLVKEQALDRKSVV